MPAQSLTPNVFTYNALVSTCGKGSQWDPAIQLFEDLAGKRAEKEEDRDEHLITQFPDCEDLARQRAEEEEDRVEHLISLQMDRSPTPSPYYEEGERSLTPSPYYEERNRSPTVSPYYEELNMSPTSSPYYEERDRSRTSSAHYEELAWQRVAFFGKATPTAKRRKISDKPKPKCFLHTAVHFRVYGLRA